LSKYIIILDRGKRFFLGVGRNKEILGAVYDAFNFRRENNEKE
jgi:hypothetical protein